MINQQRVRRIKNVIYAILLLLMIVPAIILIIVGVRMLFILRPLDSIVEQIQYSQSQTGGQTSGGLAGDSLGSRQPAETFPVTQAESGESGSGFNSDVSTDGDNPDDSAPVDDYGDEPVSVVPDGSVPVGSAPPESGSDSFQLGTGETQDVEQGGSASSGSDTPGNWAGGWEPIPNTGLPRAGE